tara:strand:+ start:130 stop:384 length:255 start_codon:yes stop_codon:yes gene_type:complete
MSLNKIIFSIITFSLIWAVYSSFETPDLRGAARTFSANKANEYLITCLEEKPYPAANETMCELETLRTESILFQEELNRLENSQ